MNARQIPVRMMENVQMELICSLVVALLDMMDQTVVIGVGLCHFHKLTLYIIICAKSNHNIYHISIYKNLVTPQKPSNFKAGNVGTTTMTLSWDAPSQGTEFIESYELYWDVSTGRVWIQ